MKPYACIFHLSAVTLALACGDSTGEPTDGSTSASSSTATTAEPTTTPVDTSQSGTTEPDPTVATSLDSSDGNTTAVGAAEIEVSIEGRAVADQGTYSLATPVDVGATGEAVTVTIENVGTAELSIAAVTLPAGDTAHFVLDDAELDGTLSPGTSTSVTVAFAPGNGGRKQVELRIDSDDADEAEHTVLLDATSTPNVWRDLDPATLPPARFNAAMAATDDGRILLFGGRLASGMRVADTWLFDVEAGDWTELAPPDAPSARDASAMAFVGADAIVLFGGNETSGPGGSVTPLADTWVFDLAAATWTELAPDTSPPPRFQHAMATVGESTAILQGGRSEFMMEYPDTWSFDGASQTWTDLAPAVDPGPRSAFALASDGAGRLVMVGGSTDSTTFVDETWTYAAAANTWTMGAAAGLGVQFNNAAAWLAGDGFVAFSGKVVFDGNPVPGTWGYSAGTDVWTDLAPATEPAPRFSHRMVSTGGNKAIMFGGLLVNADLASATAQTWEYVGPG
jgi:hypothetical protein